MAQLIIYREKSMVGMALAMNCYVNDQILCKVKNGQEISCQVSNSLMEFKCGLPLNPMSKPIMLDFSNGGTIKLAVRQEALLPTITVMKQSQFSQNSANQDSQKRLFNKQCPKCGSVYKPANYRCDCCGSFLFAGQGNYMDFSHLKSPYTQNSLNKSEHFGDIFLFGKLAATGERPILMAGASYITGITSAAGKLVLTDRSLLFGASASLNVGRLEARIDLSHISEAKVTAEMLVSQRIRIKTREETHFFVVNNGHQFILKIKEAMEDRHNRQNAGTSSQKTYIEELRQLKQLLDMGIITPEEFNAKKKDILFSGGTIPESSL